MQSTQTIPQENSNHNAPLDTVKWEAIIADWESSKESQKAYCERKNLHFNTFTYMRGKFLAKDKKQNGTGFVAVKIKSEAKQISPLPTVTIENSKGIKVHIPSSMNESQLKSLLILLGW